MKIVAHVEAKPEAIVRILQAKEGDIDGRGNWKLFRTSDGDLIFGCFPHGDTYEILSQTGGV